MIYNINGFKINNVPEYAVKDVESKGYVIIARYVGDELWFYGSYPVERVDIVADEVGGLVLRRHG